MMIYLTMRKCLAPGTFQSSFILCVRQDIEMSIRNRMRSAGLVGLMKGRRRTRRERGKRRKVFKIMRLEA
jgi:hypothetical protein